MKTEDEIQEMMDRAADAISSGSSKFRGMTYEQGVEYALMWVLEQLDGDDTPLDD